MPYLSDPQVRLYRQLYNQGKLSFLDIRREAGVPRSTLEQILTGYTRATAGGPFAASLAGVETRFPDEKKKDAVWRKGYMKQYHSSKAKKQRNRALQILGGKCVKCRTTENLQFDHIDPATKSFHIGQQITGSWEEIEKELKKCQLLCYRCHKIKSGKESAAFNARVFSGERSSRAKLTDAQAEQYRIRFKAGELNMHDIARETSMATKNVRWMLRGLTYQRAGGPLASADEALNYITPERRERYKDQVAELYRQGTTKPHEICKKVPVCGHTAKRYLEDMGLVPGRRTGQGNHNAKMTDEQVRGYRKMFREGQIKATEIADATGLSVKGVYQMLKGQTYRSVR